MKKKHINLATYDDFERLTTFDDEIDAYRSSKLQSAKDHVGFIKTLFPNRKVTVLELGSGNSKTLFALEKAGVLKKGYGVEVSNSRYEFAELWKKEWGFKLVENLNEDVVEIDFQAFENFDLCFCVDLAFQFFEPIKKDAPRTILKVIYKKLAAGGKIVLELDGCERIVNRMMNNNVRLWEDFPPPDPWSYSLWDCSLDPQKTFLKWKKIFIKRDGSGLSENTMIIRVYKKNDIRKLLQEAGFSKIDVYANWKGKKFKDDAGEYIIVATK